MKKKRPRQRANVTIRAEWEGLVMFFGTSTGVAWTDRLLRFCDLYKFEKPRSIRVSYSPWIDGLDWCSDENFQRELDREGQDRWGGEDFTFRRPTPAERKLFNATFRKEAICG